MYPSKTYFDKLKIKGPYKEDTIPNTIPERAPFHWVFQSEEFLQGFERIFLLIDSEKGSKVTTVRPYQYNTDQPPATHKRPACNCFR